MGIYLLNGKSLPKSFRVRSECRWRKHFSIVHRETEYELVLLRIIEGGRILMQMCFHSIGRIPREPFLCLFILIPIQLPTQENIWFNISSISGIHSFKLPYYLRIPQWVNVKKKKSPISIGYKIEYSRNGTLNLQRQKLSVWYFLRIHFCQQNALTETQSESPSWILKNSNFPLKSSWKWSGARKSGIFHSDFFCTWRRSVNHEVEICILIGVSELSRFLPFSSECLPRQEIFGYFNSSEHILDCCICIISLAFLRFYESYSKFLLHW